MYIYEEGRFCIVTRASTSSFVLSEPTFVACVWTIAIRNQTPTTLLMVASAPDSRHSFFHSSVFYYDRASVDLISFLGSQGILDSNDFMDILGPSGSSEPARSIQYISSLPLTVSMCPVSSFFIITSANLTMLLSISTRQQVDLLSKR